MPPPSADAASRDRDIVELLQGGQHEAAFSRLLERYENKVYRLCCGLLRDAAQAHDVAQESWIRIWRAMPSYDGRASLSTWIYAITRNRCLTALERRRDLASLSDPAVEMAAESLQIQPEDPEDPMAQLRELVDALPERYRVALTMFYYEERSISEVASMLGMPEGTVKTTLFRARGALAEQMRRCGLDSLDLWLKATA